MPFISIPTNARAVYYEAKKKAEETEDPRDERYARGIMDGIEACCGRRVAANIYSDVDCMLGGIELPPRLVLELAAPEGG